MMQADLRDRDRRRREPRARRRDRHLRTAHELDAQLLRFDVSADHPVDAIAIRDRQRPHPEPVRLLHQLLGMARAFEKREVRLAPEWRVRVHELDECSVIRRAGQASRNIVLN
jgi:hypothetical protein